MRALLVLPPLVLSLWAIQARANDVPIEQANHSFSQTEITLAAGDALVMHNDDGTTHDLSVVDEDGEPQDIGVQAPGKTLRIAFANAGHYTVRCSLTPGMHMRVIVN